MRAGSRAGRAELRKMELSLTSMVVGQSLDGMVRQYDPSYTQFWSGLPDIQQKTLLVVITEHGVNLRSTKVVRALGHCPFSH